MISPLRSLFRPWLRLGLFLAALTSAQVGRAASPALVQVRVDAPAVAYYSFPAGRPPPEAKELSGMEAGLCYTQLSTEIRIGVEYPRFSIKKPVITVTSVEFVVGARITIWVEEGSPPKILEHENGHRAISEHYYQQAYPLARELGEKAVGRKLPLSGKPTDATIAAATEGLRNELLMEFEKQIDQRNRFAQAAFDKITDHSRNDVPNKEAVAKAIAEEERHRAAGSP
jgi:hypothetical protein